MSAARVEVHETAIDGLLIVDLPRPGDNRGWFKENWQRAKATAAGLPDFVPVQNNISFNGPGAPRAASTLNRGPNTFPWPRGDLWCLGGPTTGARIRDGGHS